MRSFYGFIIIVFLATCQESDPVATNTLSFKYPTQWRVETVMKDGEEDLSFGGMVLSFSATDYSTNLTGNPIWPSHGQYIFENQNSFLLVRDDQNEFRISFTSTQMVMQCDFREIEYGSSRPKVYHYTFSFSRQ